MAIDSIIKKWQKLHEEVEANPLYRDPAYYRIKPLEMDLFNPFYMSANIKKEMAIYIEFPMDDIALKSCSFPNLNGVSIDVCKEKKISDKNEYLRIAKDENCPEELFISLCISLVEGVEISASNKASILVVDDVLREYSNMFTKKHNQLGKEEEQGLYCELLYLEQLMDACGEEVVKNWTGPQKNKHDFIFDDNKSVEIKSTRNQEQLIIHISNENQLDNTGLDELKLVTYVVEITPVGESLNDVIKRIFTKIQRPDIHMIFLTDLLTFKIDPNGYEGSYRFTVVGKHTFLVTDDFPKITKSSLLNNIYDVKYRLNISDQQEIGG